LKGIRKDSFSAEGPVNVYRDISKNKKGAPLILKTRAVVLREIKYRDQSKILTLYTREFGKLACILKGGRNPKNRLSGIFSAGNVLDIVLYRKPEREVQLISDGSLVSCPMVPGPDIERFGVLYRIIDLVRLTTERDSRSLRLFSLLESTLLELNRERVAYRTLYAWFLLRFISLQGFAPELCRCVFSGREIPGDGGEGPRSELLFVMNPGGLALPGTIHADGRNVRPIIPEAADLLAALSRTATAASAADGSGTAEGGAALICGTILQEYCRHHLEHAGGQKNLAVISQLLAE
jgi:DNA repair protein RecO (recombination protein O)